MSQRDRRREPYPWTWEPAALVSATLLAVLVVGAQLGRAAANLAVGGAVLLPPTLLGWVTSTPAVLAGDADAGLTPSTPTAGSVLLGWSIALVGLILVGLLLFGAVVCWRRFGRGGVQGMATPGEVRSVLGRHRLHQNGHLIRPDLYQRGRQR